MFGLINLFTDRLSTIDLSNPLGLLDLAIAAMLVISFLIYMRRFPVFRVMLGVLFLWVLALIFLFLRFTFTALLFGLAANVVLISMPLIFAPEIRHYLEKLGRFSFLKVPSVTRKQRDSAFLGRVMNAAFFLADKKIGATIVIQRRTGLGQTIETGVILNAVFSQKLLESIFFPKSPLHDGAVIIVGNRILAANCLLPIYGEIKLDPPFGTRHAASVGITKDTDAVALIISEQRGEVSVAENGKLHANLKKDELEKMLQKLLG